MTVNTPTTADTSDDGAAHGERDTDRLAREEAGLEDGSGDGAHRLPEPARHG